MTEVVLAVVMNVFFLLAPAGVLWLCRRIPWLGKIGPVFVLYVVGLIVGNLFHFEAKAQIQDVLSSAMVPLAIPLMLSACTFSMAQTRSQLLAMLTGMVSVVIAVIAGFFLFGRDIENGARIGGMLTGVYTGGTINLAALKTMLGVGEETFILLNSYDLVVSFLYLSFLLAVGVRFFRKILPVEKGVGADFELSGAEGASPDNPYKGLFSRAGLRDTGFLLLVDIVIIGISAGVAALMPGGLFMTVLILLLTSLGIAASFLKKVKACRWGYDVGMYFIYIFSIVVASMADFSKLQLGDSLGMLYYLTFVIFGSLLIQVIFALIFRIDADTMTISSVTYICSPPFVPMMAAAMKNRSVLASGLAIGVVGYAVGNYLGFLMASLLELF